MTANNGRHNIFSSSGQGLEDPERVGGGGLPCNTLAGLELDTETKR